MCKINVEAILLSGWSIRACCHQGSPSVREEVIFYSPGETQSSSGGRARCADPGYMDMGLEGGGASAYERARIDNNCAEQCKNNTSVA